MRCISTAMFAILVLVVVAGTAHGQGSESLDKKQKTFETKKKDADKKMAQAFDKVVENIHRDKSLPVETRSRRIASLRMLTITDDDEVTRAIRLQAIAAKPVREQ